MTKTPTSLYDASSTSMKLKKSSTAGVSGWRYWIKKTMEVGGARQSIAMTSITSTAEQ